MSTGFRLKRTEGPLSTGTTNKGLTLIEVLIALAITGIVITGLYSAFATTIDVEDGLKKRTEGLREYLVFSELLRSDIRTMLDRGVKVETGFYGDEMSFQTTNSLYYAFSRPVRVRYFVREVDGKEVLFREETDSEGSELMRLRLFEDIEGFEVYFYADHRWKKEPRSDDFIRVVYTYMGRKWSVTAGRLI